MMKNLRQGSPGIWWFHRGIAVSFFVFLWVPLIGVVIDFDPTSSVAENRQLARFPGADGSEISRAQFRAFFADHLGLRDAMLRLHANVKLAVFKTANHRVVLGEDGWFFCDYNRAVKAATGRIKLDISHVQQWKAVLKQRADYLGDRGIKYAFLLVPDKHYVHGDHLPGYLRSPLGPTVFDQFVEGVSLSNVHLMDLRRELLNASAHNDTFYKGDTHWNGYGIEAGYHGILRGLREIIGPRECLEPVEVQVTLGDKPRSGDLHRVSGVDGLNAESVIGCRVRHVKARQVAIPHEYVALEKEYLLDDKRVKAYENPSIDGTRLVMFHTSFSQGAIRDLLAEHFSRVVFVRHPRGHPIAFHKKIVEQERPDIVINEIPSRFLTTNPLVGYDQRDWKNSTAQVASKSLNSAHETKKR